MGILFRYKTKIELHQRSNINILNDIHRVKLNEFYNQTWFLIKINAIFIDRRKTTFTEIINNIEIKVFINQAFKNSLLQLEPSFFETCGLALHSHEQRTLPHNRNHMVPATTMNVKLRENNYIIKRLIFQTPSNKSLRRKLLSILERVNRPVQNYFTYSTLHR